MAAFEAKKAELEALGVTVIAATTDTLEQVRKVARDDPGLTFPTSHGVTRGDAELLGSWWSEDRDGYIQPTEFILTRDVVLGAMYASGPVGRMGVDEVIRLITNRERSRQASPRGPRRRYDPPRAPAMPSVAEAFIRQ